MKSTDFVLIAIMCMALVVVVGPTGEAADPDDLHMPQIGGLDVAVQPEATDYLARKAEMMARFRQTVSAPVSKAEGAKTVFVDCNKGKSLQKAIDDNPGPAVIEVSGLCYENVRIKNGWLVTLRGNDPATDGIRGERDYPNFSAALEIRRSSRISIENLSINDSLGIGLLVTYSNSVTLENCWFTGNGSLGVYLAYASRMNARDLIVSENQTGVWVMFDSRMDAFDLMFSENHTGLEVRHNSSVACTGCTFEDNTGFAATSRWYSYVTLWQSSVSGPLGLWVTADSFADIDCISQPEYPSPCGMFAGQTAVRAVGGGAGLANTGDFSGQLFASGGNIDLLGARQVSTGEDWEGNPLANEFFDSSVLAAKPYVDNQNPGNPVQESTILGDVNLTLFSRAILLGETVVEGSLICESASDAWADAGVTVNGSVTGCEHYVPPPGP
jgi:parallel beta-helix repeat protein